MFRAGKGCGARRRRVFFHWRRWGLYFIAFLGWGGFVRYLGGSASFYWRDGCGVEMGWRFSWGRILFRKICFSKKGGTYATYFNFFPIHLSWTSLSLQIIFQVCM